MELSLGGLPFIIPSDETIAELDRIYPFRDTSDVQPPDVVRHPRDYFGLPVPPPVPAVGSYQYFRPAGARRFGVFRGLMHRTEVEKPAFGTAMGSGAAFKMDDGTNPPALNYLYALPPRPVCGVNAVTDAYLVTLVDARFFHCRRRNHPFVAQDNTWAGMIADIGLNLGTVFGDTAIEAVYARPAGDAPWHAEAMTAAASLDALAATTGRLVTWSSSAASGNYVLIRHAAANTAAAAARAAVASPDSGGALWPAGTTDPGRNRAPIIPALINVLFPKWVRSQTNSQLGHYWGLSTDDTSRPFPAPTLAGWPEAYITKALTPAGLGAPYSGWTTAGGGPGAVLTVVTQYKALQSYLGMNVPFGTPTNDAALDTVAAQLAKDALDALNANLDETYDGTPAFDPASGADLTYTWRRGRLSLRVSRRPFNHEHPFLWLADDPTTSADWLIHERLPHSAVLQGGGPGAPILDFWLLFGNAVADIGHYVLPRSDYSGGTPGASHDVAAGYAIGSRVVVFGTDEYVCVDNAAGAAVWMSTTGLPASIPAASITGILNVVQGGTGAATLTSGAVLFGNGTSPVTQSTSARVGSTGIFEIQLSGTRWLRSGVASI